MPGARPRIRGQRKRDGRRSRDFCLRRQTRWTQDRIASRSGFRSVDALQKAFARQYGITPRVYRDRARPLSGHSEAMSTGA
jgi:AraC-like DNA-binding protein